MVLKVSKYFDCCLVFTKRLFLKFLFVLFFIVHFDFFCFQEEHRVNCHHSFVVSWNSRMASTNDPIGGLLDLNDTIICPYNTSHVVGVSRMQQHLYKCRKVSIVPVHCVICIWC